MIHHVVCPIIIILFHLRPLEESGKVEGANVDTTGPELLLVTLVIAPEAVDTKFAWALGTEFNTFMDGSGDRNKGNSSEVEIT